MTKGIHYSNRSPWNRLQYNPTIDSYWIIVGTSSADYQLKGFLAALGTPKAANTGTAWAVLDCRAFAGLLHLALSSQGKTSSPVKIKASAVNGDSSFQY